MDRGELESARDGETKTELGKTQDSVSRSFPLLNNNPNLRRTCVCLVDTRTIGRRSLDPALRSFYICPSVGASWEMSPSTRLTRACWVYFSCSPVLLYSRGFIVEYRPLFTKTRR